MCACIWVAPTGLRKFKRHFNGLVDKYEFQNVQ